MKEKKNIDRIFQERFKNFEAQPSPKVWEGIQARLDKKKKKHRVIPLWIKVGSVAAVLALLAIIADFYTEPSATHQQVVDGDNTNEIHKNPPTPNQPTLTNVDSAGSAESNSSNSGQFVDNTGQAESETGTPENSVNTKNAVVTNSDKSETEQSGIPTSTKDSRKSEENKPDQKRLVNITPKDSVKRRLNDKAFAENHSDLYSDPNRDSISEQPILGENQQKSNSGIAFISKKDSLKNVDKNTGKLATNEGAKRADTLSQKKSLLELLDEKKNENEALAAESEVEKEKAEAKRWGVTPMVAPVYYNSFSGSGIGPQFSESSKDGEVNLSYGVQLSYAVSDRIQLRSGVNKVKLGYSTNNVGFSAGRQSMAIASIKYSENADVLTLSGSPLDNAYSNALNSGGSKEFAVPVAQSGTLQQRLAYYEIPLEMAYELVNNKIGVQLIGGLSTLFLNEDEILLQESGTTTVLGRSNSLNEVSFSTNIGVGLDYKFSKSVKFNLEPMFKYQLNAYKNSVQDFKPYYLGLYTGVSIKF